MHSTWRTQDDFMNDIWAMSEIEGIARHEVEEPPPASILEYRAQMAANNNSSVYDNFHPNDEGVTYIISGRGRGGVSTILRPGVSTLSDSLVTEDVHRKIRQVSGLGYSNALIEQGVRAMTIAKHKGKNSASPVKHTSPQVTTTSKSPQASGVSTSTEKEGTSMEKERAVSSCSSLSSNSPHPGASVAEGAASAPLPLSVMRKQAQEQRKKDKEKASKASSTNEVKKKENPSHRRSSKSPCNGHTSPLQNAESGLSSDDSGVWGRRNNSQPKPQGFTLDCNEFPALK